MKLQMLDKEKKELCDFVIENNSDIQNLENEFELIFKKLI